MKFRNFSDILAGRQGGIYLKPGQTVRKVLPKSLIKEIFGEEIAAYSSPNLTLTIKEISDEECVVVVSRGKTAT